LPEDNPVFPGSSFALIPDTAGARNVKLRSAGVVDSRRLCDFHHPSSTKAESLAAMIRSDSAVDHAYLAARRADVIHFTSQASSARCQFNDQ
jgi:hypothetical protein